MGNYSVIAPAMQEYNYNVISMGKTSVITNLIRSQEINNGEIPISVVSVGRPSLGKRVDIFFILKKIPLILMIVRSYRSSR